MRISAPIAIVPVSIIGLGNVFLGDDGFGPLAVETFRSEYAVEPVAVEVLDLGTPGLDLAPYLYGRKLVIIVDAVHAALPAGTLSIFSEHDFASERAQLRITGHDPGLWESLAHLRLSGEAPQELIVLGGSPESCGFAEQISPKLLSTASEAAATIAQLLMERGVGCNLRNEAATPNLWWLPAVQVNDAVLSTRLSAVDEAATIDVLCSDKTGTLTRNELSVTSVRPLPGFDEAHVLGMAALASSVGGQDSVDSAIRSAASKRPANDLPKLKNFVPFDPAKKISEATATDAKSEKQRIVKGAFAAVSVLATPSPSAAGLVNDLEKRGFRVLAVAAGPPQSMQLIGLLALSDPPRNDSSALISELHHLGVRTVMVTGDASETAAVVAHAVGLAGAVCPPGPLPINVKPEDFAVFASILPEGKYDLVKAFQKSGHTVGMCGDGANDAPALRQAQIGIAVSTATDVAKSAAGVVLTEAGLGGVVAAVKEGRITFQRILNYTLNSILKKIVQLLLLAAGLVITGHAVLTPMLMIIVMITGDFLAMSLTTDNVQPSETPNSWRTGEITSAGAVLGAVVLTYCLTALAIGKFEMRLGIAMLRTLSVVAVVFGSQATIYAIRGHRSFLGLRPTGWLIASSMADLMIISTLAILGIAMAPLPAAVVACEFGGALLLGLTLAAIKIPVFSRLHIA